MTKDATAVKLARVHAAPAHWPRKRLRWSLRRAWRRLCCRVGRHRMRTVHRSLSFDVHHMFDAACYDCGHEKRFQHDDAGCWCHGHKGW